MSDINEAPGVRLDVLDARVDLLERESKQMQTIVNGLIQICERQQQALDSLTRSVETHNKALAILVVTRQP